MFVATILRVLMRIVDAFGEANRRVAEREVARAISRSGGRLTDALERRIERSYL